VLGLTPLLFEQSTQAQFLKPTVITLVYGLGFGMVLVLVVVPALLAIGRDLSQPITALRRGLHVRGLRTPLGTGAAMVLAWFAATMGWVLVTGDLPAPFAALGSGQPLAVALGLFIAGAGLALVLVWLGALVAHRRPA
jgi:Cu/Ag efflux pump CusA